MPLVLELDEVLKSLGSEELEKFKWYLQNSANAVPATELEGANRNKVISVLTQIYGENARNICIEILTKMNRKDLAHRLKGRIMPLTEKLNEVLQSLVTEELETFKWYLQREELLNGPKAVPASKLEGINRNKVVDVLLQTYGEEARNISITILTKMNRNDLVHHLKIRSTSESEASDQK